MVIPIALALMAPASWGDLLTRPASAWDARLGRPEVSGATKGEGGFTLQTRRYRQGLPRVTFVGGKPSRIEWVVPAAAKEDWRGALRVAGLPTRGATVKGNVLAIPGLPSGVRVRFAKPTLEVSIPMAVRLAPDRTERTAILDAARAEVLRSTKEKVIFRVAELRVGDGWAFLNAEPRTPADKRANWRRLNPAGFEADAYDPVGFFLLRRQSAGWKVVALDLGPTDVAWADWSERFRVPWGLFTDRPVG